MNLFERASGRRSETESYDARLRDLAAELSPIFNRYRCDPGAFSATTERRAFLYLWEAYAWAIFQKLQAALFARRIGPPRNDADTFTLWQKNGTFDLVEARFLRQACEARFLASRDAGKLDADEILRNAAADWPRLAALIARVSIDEPGEPGAPA